MALLAGRRGLLAGGAAALAGRAAAQTAEPWPFRTMQVLIGLPAGGLVDVVNRLVIPHMERALGATLVPTQFLGAGGLIALQRLMAAPADGATLLFTPSDTLTARPIFARSPIHHDDLTPIGGACRTNGFVLVRPDSPWRGLRDMVAAAQGQPDRYSYASPGAGGVPHVMMEELSRITGIKLVHVPFNGTPAARLALMRGDVDMVVTGVLSPDMRALATYAEARASTRPDAPTFRELGYDLSMSVHFMMVARRGVPEPLRARLEAAFRAGAQAPEVRQQMQAAELEAEYRTPAEMRAVLDAERAIFDRALNALGLVGTG